MLNWIKKLFGIKGEVTPLPDPEPKPSELVQKLSDWVLGIKREDMLTQKEGDYGFDITCNEWRDEEYIRTKYVLWEGDKNKVDPVRSIEILRLETNTLDFHKHHISYFIMEVCRGENKLSHDDLVGDNLNLDNRPTVKHMFYHVKALHNYSSQQKLLNKLRKQQEEDYKKFTEEF
jgi:hypothetical protein